MRNRITLGILSGFLIGVLVLAGCSKGTSTTSTTTAAATTAKISTTATQVVTTTTASSTTTTKPPTATTPAAPVKIGVLLPLTGTLSGEEASRGFKYAADAINKSGGIKSLGGAQIQLVFADHKTDPKVGITEAERLMTQEKVSVVAGLMSSGVVASVIPLAEKYQVPLIDNGSVAGSLFQLKSSWWRSVGIPIDTMATLTTTSFVSMVQEYKIKADRIGILLNSGSTYDAALPATMAVLKQAGLDGKVVLSERYSPADDLVPLTLKLKAANLDVLLGAGGTSDTVTMVKSWNNVGYQPPVYMTMNNTLFDPAMMTAVGPQLVDLVLHQPGMFGLPRYTPATAAAYKPYVDFVKNYQVWATANNVSTTVPDWINAGALTMGIVGKVLETTGSRDPVALNNALRDFKLSAGDPLIIDPALASGIQWDSTGKLLSGNLVLAQWVKATGTVEAIYPVSQRTHAPWLK